MFKVLTKGSNARYSRLQPFDTIDSEPELAPPQTMVSRIPRPRLWQVLLTSAVLVSVAVYFTLTSRQGFIRNHHTDQNDASVSKYYRWRTVTSFPTVEIGANSSLEQICAHFPKHKLRDFQPVLKTGHGVMERVRKSLLSTSACLDNLLIFSDLDEEVGGHHAFDVIADIPSDMLENTDGQTAPYFELQALAANGSLNDDTLSRVKGWNTDKFKFLTTISRAWRMAPDKRWYVFYEGDTYVVWDTVFRLLENFDADQAHYFGSPSPGREGTWFANGGPGYILSRGAMRKLTRDDWDGKTGEWLGSKLLENYWNLTLGDCCGDSVLGWALHERGVDLKGLWPMFNPHPLQGIPFSDLYWCEPALTMHKSFFEAEIELWRWEWGARSVDPERPILWRDIATSFWNFTSLTDRREDWDNSEWDAYQLPDDHPNHPHDSIDSCAAACAKGENCFQWTYHLRRCTFVRSFRMGRTKEPTVEEKFQDRTWTEEDKRFTAGWDTVKLKRWMDDRPCHEIKWVRPSISRIF